MNINHIDKNAIMYNKGIIALKASEITIKAIKSEYLL
jgi:hypothetical protein